MVGVVDIIANLTATVQTILYLFATWKRASLENRPAYEATRMVEKEKREPKPVHPVLNILRASHREKGVEP
jgi:hypothetical protein